MSRLSQICLASLIFVAGCQNVTGPFKPRSPARVDDPALSLTEQEKLGRARLSVPEQSSQVLPQTGGGLPNAPGFR
ncbi:MAG: hypothetical protein HY040_02905 [Planctomycetes bacterium]|nr:hypothetical protein [Planctomycetota bacterium]